MRYRPIDVGLRYANPPCAELLHSVSLLRLYLNDLLNDSN